MTLTYCETCGEGYHDGMREVYISFSEDTVNITWACEFCAREFELEEKSEVAMQFLQSGEIKTRHDITSPIPSQEVRVFPGVK